MNARSRSHERYHSDPEYRRAQEGRQKKARSAPETWFSTRIRGLKNRAKSRGWAFALTAADLEHATHCPVFGTPLAYGSGRGDPSSPSIDRLDNGKGYVPGNVWIISRRANTLKGDATLAELERLVAAMKARGAR